MYIQCYSTQVDYLFYCLQLSLPIIRDFHNLYYLYWQVSMHSPMYLDYASCYYIIVSFAFRLPLLYIPRVVLNAMLISIVQNIN